MPDGQLSEISQLLAIAVDMDGEPTQGHTDEDVAALQYRLFYEFGQSEIGREVYARGGDAVVKRIENIYLDRAAGRSYATMDALGELEEIGRDLLVDLPDLPAEPEPIARPAAPARLTPEQEHAKLVQKIRSDQNNPAISAASIRAKRDRDPKYRRAFLDANQPDVQIKQVPVADAKVIQFSHIYLEAVRAHGINSVKPRAGIVTLKLENKKSYAYPYTEFKKLEESAAQSELI